LVLFPWQNDIKAKCYFLVFCESPAFCCLTAIHTKTAAFRFGSVALSFIALLGLSTFPSWYSEVDSFTGSEVDVKPFPSRPVAQVCLGLSSMAALFSLVSALWQHTSAASAAAVIEVSAFGTVHTHIGGVAVALVWLGLVFVIITTIGLLFMLLSMTALDRLTGD
jgi:hypothetical protein